MEKSSKLLMVMATAYFLSMSSSFASSELTLTLPQITVEGAGSIDGIVEVDTVVPTNTHVSIISDNPSEVGDGTVTILSGTKSAPFSLNVVDDALLDGVQTASLKARSEGYTDASASVFIEDNDEKALFLDLPDDLFEGHGTLTNAAKVYLNGITVSDLHILLQSSDTTEATVPVSVIIKAGQSNAVFSISIIDDTETDGWQSSTITASFPGYVQASDVLAVGDNEFDSFTISGPEGDLPGNVPLLVTVEATTIDGHVLAGYSGEVDLSARSTSSASLQIEPSERIELINGRWQGAVTIQQSEDTNVQLEASDRVGHSGLSAPFNLFTLNVRKMVTDWSLPYIYMIHRDPDPFASWRLYPGSKLLWYNTDFNAVERVVNPGDDVSDMTVHYGDNRIYVSNYGHEETRVFDRVTRVELDPLNLGTDVSNISAGQPGCVYTAESQWISYMHAFSTTNGSELARSPSWVYSGVAESTIDGRYLYMCSTKGSTEKVVKYDTSANTFNQVDALVPGTDLNHLVISMDGRYVYCNQSVYDSDFNEIRSIGSEIYAASAFGDLALSDSSAYNSHTGEEIFTLPFTTRYMAFSGDQSRLVLYNAADGSVMSLDTSVIMPLPPAGMMPDPGEGEVHPVSLSELSWTLAVNGAAYEVYFGTDSNVVATAGTNSLEYLGRTEWTDLPLSEGRLDGSQTYYWRVDALTHNGDLEKGEVWHFKTASIVVDPAELVLEGLAANYTQTVRVAVNSAVGDPAAWSVSCASEWVVLEKTNGIAPGTLDIDIDLSSLAAGTYSTDLVFSDEQGSFSVPISLSVEMLNIVKMETDWTKPYIYMLHDEPINSYPRGSKLIWYNTEAGAIEAVRDAGENASDFTIHYQENRIYVNNAAYDEKRVFDRMSKQELPSALFGSTVENIHAGAAGRIYVMEKNDPNGLRLLDTADGSVLNYTRTTYSGYGAGLVDGRTFYLYRSSNEFVKFNASNDVFEEVVIKTIPRAGPISTTVDGTRVCMEERIYDGELNELLDLNIPGYEYIRAISAFGNLVLTENSAYDGSTGENIYALPFEAHVMALSADQSKLMLFNEDDASIVSLNTSDIMPLPAYESIPSPSIDSVQGINMTELSWTLTPEAVAYDIYLGTDADVLLSAQANSTEYLGRSTHSGFTLPEDLLIAGQSYYWRVDVILLDGSVVQGNTWSFQTAPFYLDPTALVVAGLATSYTQTVSVAVNSAGGTPLGWTASCDDDWVIMVETNGTIPSNVLVGFDMSRLSKGYHFTEIEFSSGSAKIRLPVTLRVDELRIVKMATDWTQPYVYMIHTAEVSPNPSSLIWYNTDTDSIEQVLDAGENATDLTVHYADDRIYVSNWEREETRVFDRSTQQELNPLFFGNEVYQVNAGGEGRIYAEKDRWVASIRVLSTTTGAELYQWGTLDGGATECTLDGRYLFRESGEVTKYDLSGGTLTSVAETEYSSGQNNMIIGVDGKRIFSNKAVYDDDLNKLLDIGSVIYGASAYGDLVISDSTIYNGVSGDEIQALPFATSVMAFSGDQARLVLFNSEDASLTSIATSTIMPLPEPGMMPDPTIGSIQRSSLPGLSWSGAPAPLAHDVYLGSDSNAVVSASTNAAVYLGRFPESAIALQAGLLAGNETYFWRVDTISYTGAVTKGEVWHFSTASIDIDPYEFDLNGVVASYTQRVSVAVSNVVSAPVNWTASCDSDWVILDATNGIAPDTLEIGIAMTGLAAGDYAAEIELRAASQVLTIPVSLKVHALNVVKMQTDWKEPYIYMLNTAVESPYESHLIWYNTDTAGIEQVQEAGLNADNLTVHYWNDRIYVNNAGTEKQAFDRTAKEAVAPLALANSESGISAAGAGRVVVEGATPYIRIGLQETASGTELDYHYYVAEGDGACSPDGLSYYHADSDYPDSDLFKFSVGSTSLTYETRTATTNLGWGTFDLLVGMDGQRIYNRGLIFDSELNLLRDIGAEIHGASAYGDLVITDSRAYSGETGQEVYTLPFVSKVMAFSGDQSRLVLFNAEDATLSALDASEIMPLSAPRAIPDPSEGSGQGANLSELAWTTMLGTSSYVVYLGTDSNAVASATTNSTEYLGTCSSPNCPLPEGLLSGGRTYFWRVDSIGPGGAVEPGEVWNFHTSNMTLDTYEVSLVGVVADYTQSVSVAVDSASGAPAAWTVSSADNMIVLPQSNGTSPAELTFGVDMSGLAAGTHVANVTVSDGAVSLNIEVKVDLHTLNVVKMEADRQLPYIYLAHTSKDYDSQSLLLWYNTELGAIEQVVRAGQNATDLTVHYGDDRIYMNNWKYEATRVFDRSSRLELEPLLLGTEVFSVNAGGPGRLYIEEEDQWIQVRACDTSTGAVLSMVGEREGDGACSPDGRHYYHIDYSSSGTGLLSRYDLYRDIFTDQVAVKPRRSYGSRNVFVSGDGAQVYSCGTVYDAALNEVLNLTNELYTASAYGDLVVTADQAFDGLTGAVLFDLPHSSTVMAFSGDDSSLLLFNAEDASLSRVDIENRVSIPEHEMVPKPTDGSIQSVNLAQLGWSAVPEAIGYDLYFGTDSNAVAVATTNSVEYLGPRAVPDSGIPDGLLSGDETYYWRVDSVDHEGAAEQSSVWSFHTAAFVLDHSELIMDGVMASYTQKVSIAVDSAVAEPLNWSATCTNSWIQLRTSAGTTPGSLDIGIDVDGLATGIHTGEITVSDGMHSLVVPVSLTVVEMNVVKMEADRERPYVYLLHKGGTSSGYDPVTPAKSLLIWYDTDADNIEQVQQAGANANDLAVHYGDDRIYVSNYDRFETRVFDRSAKREMEPLSLGTDVYSLSAGRAGRLYSRSYSTSRLIAWNTTNSLQLASVQVRLGAGECSPDGRYYYHGDDYYYSGAYLHKFDLSNDTFEEVVSILNNYRSNKNLVVSGDSQRVYNYNFIFDADLNQLRDLGSRIYAATTKGDLVASNYKVYNGISGAEVYTLPFSTWIMAFSGDESRLLLYNNSDHRLTSLDMSEVIPLPETTAGANPGNGTAVNAAMPEVSWTPLTEALGYEVYLGLDSNAVATATAGSAEYFGRHDAAVFKLPDDLLTGDATYYWRVDAVGFGGAVVPGAVWHFNVASIAVDPHALVVDGFVASYTQRVSVAVDSSIAGAVSWSAGCTNDWVLLAMTNGTTSGSVEVGIDMTGLAEGDYSAQIVFDDGTDSFEVPVSLTVQKLRINKMVADGSKPYIYMLHDDPSIYYPKTSKLIWYNTETHAIEQVQAAGFNATDLTVHYGEDRIYVNNEDYPETRVFDRSSRQELDPLLLNSDVFKINAGRVGRLYTQAGNSASLTVWDTSNGTEITNKANWVGDGECTMDGRFYYHVDNRSGAAVHKFDLAEDALATVTNIPANNYYGSQNLLLNRDGSRVYNCGVVYDEDLNPLVTIGPEMYAVSASGDLVATQSEVVDGVTGESVYTLPFATQKMAFSRDQSSLVLFNGSLQTLTNLNVSAFQPAASAVPSTGYAAWQEVYFPDTKMAAGTDGDGDGVSNLDEYIAGTDPTSVSSYFAMYDAEPLSDGQMVLYWQSVTGRVYSVYWSPSLTTSFQMLEDDIFYPQGSYTDRVERVEQSGFYKVGVEFE